MHSDLDIHLAASGFNGRIVEDRILHSSPQEVTQKVWIEYDGKRTGPYVRKTFSKEESIVPYETLLRAQEKHEFSAIPHVISISHFPQSSVLLAWSEGESLADLAKAHPLSADEATYIMQLIVEGVRELHENPDGAIIHRDLTPKNILYDKQNQTVSILDLSISRTWNKESEHDTQLFGTPLYAAPEQYGYAQTNERSDLYSLGLVLFYLVCGRDATQTDFAQGFSAMQAKPLEAIVKKATSFDPNHRFQSAQEMQQALMQPHRFFRYGQHAAWFVGAVLWNTLFFLVLSFLFAVCIYVMQNPSEVLSKYTAVQLVWFYGLAIPLAEIGLFVGCCIPYALPAWLKRYIPKTFSMRLVRMLLFLGLGLLCIVAGLLF